MKPNISEFSYGYALTEEIIRHFCKSQLRAAPVFPSLRDEGSKGGGFDLRLDFGIPLFLQFKVTHLMQRTNAKEARLGIFKVPFFRMHLRSLKHSEQHNLLLELEARHNLVFYVAPAFHKVDELNRYYLSERILPRSIFVKPSAIGRLPDKKEHHVSFQIQSSMPPRVIAYRFSEPRLIETQSIVSLTELMRNIIHERGVQLSDYAFTLRAQMIEAIKERYSGESALPFRNDKYLLRTVAYLSRVYFGCEMLWVSSEEASRDVS